MFDGYTPDEVHLHHDADGNLTGRTVVKRKPLWTESDRQRAMALQEYEDSRCPCGCGLSIEESHDPNRAFVIDEVKCYARRALDRHADQLEKAAKAKNLPDSWSDGLRFVVTSSFIPESHK